MPCVHVLSFISFLVFIHKLQEGGDKFPVDADGKTLYSDVDYVEAWLAMEEALSQGLVRSIGVSNFSKDQIERVLSSGKITPVTNQVSSLK